MATGMRWSAPIIDPDILRRNWGWFVALGIAEILFGVIAAGYSVFATFFAVMLVGWLLVFGGVLAVVHAFWEKRWSGFFIDLVTGILYVAVGFMILTNPAVAAIGLTLMIALFLFIGGIFRIVAALTGHFQHGAWLLLNGIVTLVLGILIWRQWPWSGLWVIGLFIGIDMIFYGWSLVMVGLMARRVSTVSANPLQI
jgi:uncharacterized membrane protein HdeD (DUF308 family)